MMRLIAMICSGLVALAAAGCSVAPPPLALEEDSLTTEAPTSEPSTSDSDSTPPTTCDGCTAAAPLDPRSPWPKFRGNMEQTGASRLVPRPFGGSLWSYKTGKGIFSSPVVGADGTVYIGSADRKFYAIHADGSLRFAVETGEIIDSSALLDDRGRVYFGSGDGLVRALDAQTGELLWTFAADDPKVNDAFINWFEGNVAITPEGNLVVPNDNFFVYNLDRDTGERRWRWLMNDQTWSLPAIDPASGQLFLGNNYIAPLDLLATLYKNVFALDPSGKLLWRQSVQATVAASPMLVAGKLIVPAFDGYVRAYDQATGQQLWQFATRDHLYSSPALLPDGTLVQPSTDGTVYALDSQTGALRWAFDTREPIRSSPAVDGAGHIYFGGGDGQLYVLNPDGTRRFSLRLIDEDRNDLNASPALGLEAVYIAGESGEIFSVPYDYCLRPEGLADERCTVEASEDLPNQGAVLGFVSPFGSFLETPPSQIDANQPLAFSLFVREASDTVLALIDEESLRVEVRPSAEVSVLVSGDRRFLTVAPRSAFSGGPLEIAIEGGTVVRPKRDGLKLTGGVSGPRFEKTFEFEVKGAESPFELPIPAAPGDESATLELRRCAVPLPTILPSYNQIGFDSLHYLLGMVEGDAEHGIAWFIGARLTPDGRTIPDPETKVLLPLEVSYRRGLITLKNEDGFMVNAMNADIFFDTFTAAAQLGPNGQTTSEPQLHVTTQCRKIPTYGPFLIELGFCSPSTGMLNVFGSFDLRPHGTGRSEMPSGLGAVRLRVEEGTLMQEPVLRVVFEDTTLVAEEHTFGLLVVDADTGRPVSHRYGLSTQRQAGPNGEIAQVSVALPRDKLPARARVHLMVDTYPAAVFERSF